MLVFGGIQLAIIVAFWYLTQSQVSNNLARLNDFQHAEVSEVTHDKAVTDDIEDSVSRIGKVSTFESIDFETRLQQESNNIWWETLGFLILAFVTSALNVAMFTFSLIGPLGKLESDLNRISSGDKTMPLVAPRPEGKWVGIVNSIRQLQLSSDKSKSNLRKEVSRLTTVLGAMEEGVIAIDRNQQVLYANRMATILLGIEAKDVIGRQILEIVRHPKIESCVSRVFERQTSIEEEFEPIRGERRILAIQASWMSRDKNETAVLVFRDVTNMRNLENMRRDFVTNVSHELKTPLASIKAYAETLSQGAINDDANRLGFVQRIEEQANRLEDLIMDLIQLGKVESGKASFEISDVDVCQSISQSVDIHLLQAEKRDIKIDSEVPVEPILTRADEEGVQAILDNLISNAIRYTPDGGVIEVNCCEKGSDVEINVIDSGIGIAVEHHQRIFERFYRADKSRSNEFGGTGLGLSIVKHMCQSFGGEVWIESSLGKGCKFSVRLPKAKS